MKRHFAGGLVILAALLVSVVLMKPNAGVPGAAAALGWSTAPANTPTCPPGKYEASDGACKLCQRGTFSTNVDASQCTLAPPGTFVANAGATKASLCAANTYAPKAGSISCSPCPPGTTSEVAATKCCTP